MTWRTILLLTAALLAGCSRSNNLLLGRVETTVGGHRIVVTDCYRTSVPPPVTIGDGVYQFKPCRDADVLIRQSELVVNGQTYGKIKPADVILVDHSVVSVNPSKD